MNKELELGGTGAGGRGRLSCAARRPDANPCIRGAIGEVMAGGCRHFTAGCRAAGSLRRGELS